MDYIVVKQKSDMDLAIEYYMKCKAIGYDFETTGTNARKDKLRLAQMSDGKKTIILDLFHILKNAGRDHLSREENFEFFRPMYELLTNPNVIKIIHYSQFETKFAWANFNCDIVNIFDTFIASKAIDYELFSHSLANVTREHLNIDLDKTEQQSDWGRWILSEDQYNYAHLDVKYSPKLREVMLQKIINYSIEESLALDFGSILPISSAEYYGLFVNREMYSKEIDTLIKLHKVASTSLQDVMRTTKPSMGIQQSMFDVEEVNYSDVLLSSHDQVKVALRALGLPILDKDDEATIKMYERKGLPFAVGTGAKALGSLAGMHPVLKLLSDYRGVEKMVTGFGPNFLEHLVEYVYGHRVHTSFSVIGAPTGRMSSKKPNVQQIPDKKLEIGTEEYDLGFRRAFEFPKGRIGINADYSQIELRIAAEFSGCPVFMGAFRDKKDLHAMTASLIYPTTYEEAMDENHPHYKKYRKPSKNVNFGIAYGQGPSGLADQLHIPLDEAKDIINKHREAHPVLWAYLDSQAKKAINRLEARTASGRRQKFNPPTRDEKGIPSRKEQATIGRNGKNMPIQGCLGGDTRILVQGKGYVKIGDAEKKRSEVWDYHAYTNGYITESGLKQRTVTHFVGGHEITQSPNHKFWAKSRGENYQWKEAQELKSGDRIQIIQNTPLFDFLDRKDFTILKDLGSDGIGYLLGCRDSVGKIEGDKITFTISERDYPVVKQLKNIFSKLGLTYIEDNLYDSRNIKVTIEVHSAELVSDLSAFTIENGFSENFWTSKLLITAYLRTVFTFGNFQHELLELKADRSRYEWLKSIQSSLLLFGVVASVSKGLTKPFLSLNYQNVYRYILNVGIETEDNVLKLVKFKKLRSFRLHKNYNDLYLTVKEVVVYDEEIEMFDVVDSDTHTFTANGLVTHNTSADILKKALNLLYERLKGLDANIVNIVHDEITVECDEAIQDEVKRILQEAMEDGAKAYLSKVPVKVDAKPIKNWADK